jgi:type VI secretion system protein ImpA
LSELKKTIDDIRSLAEKLVKEKRILEPDAVNAEETASGEAQAGLATGAVVYGKSTGPIKSRQEALKRLAEIADYFHKTEPHSPVAYLVQRAIKWGEMPLEVWLEDVIKDTGVLSSLRETLGVKPESEGG